KNHTKTVWLRNAGESLALPCSVKKMAAGWRCRHTTPIALMERRRILLQAADAKGRTMARSQTPDEVELRLIKHGPQALSGIAAVGAPLLTTRGVLFLIFTQAWFGCRHHASEDRI